MKKENLINQFIIDTTIIHPLEKIISEFDNKNIRDCDIDWLNKQLDKFTELAAKSLFLDFETISTSNDNTILTDFWRKKYYYYFTTLLNFFKTFNDETKD